MVQFEDSYTTGYRAGKAGEPLGKFSAMLKNMGAKKVEEFMKGFLDGTRDARKEK